MPCRCAGVIREAGSGMTASYGRDGATFIMRGAVYALRRLLEAATASVLMHAPAVLTEALQLLKVLCCACPGVRVL